MEAWGERAARGPAGSGVLALPERHFRLSRLGGRAAARTPAGRPPFYADIDVLNGWAAAGRRDVIKVSYAALPALLAEYALLPAGGALGRGCGPLVVTAGAQSLAGARVAIPGERNHRLPALSALGAGSGRRVDRGAAVRQDHAGGRRRHGRRRADHPRVTLHLPDVRADRAGRPRRLVGDRDRPADPAGSDPGPPQLRRASSSPGSARRSAAASNTPGPIRRPHAATCSSTPRRWRPRSSTSTSPCTSTASAPTSATRATPRSGACWSVPRRPG